MLTALLILLAILFWGGMLFVYYKKELTAWFDNRFGPDRVTAEEERRKFARRERRAARWRWYK